MLGVDKKEQPTPNLRYYCSILNVMIIGINFILIREVAALYWLYQYCLLSRWLASVIRVRFITPPPLIIDRALSDDAV